MEILKKGKMTGQTLRVQVICYSGYRAEEEPRRFIMGKREINVTEVIDRWLDPSHRYFKIRGDDEGIYILRHDVKSNEWEMTLFTSNANPDTRLSST